jgi:hypothetical protein
VSLELESVINPSRAVVSGRYPLGNQSRATVELVFLNLTQVLREKTGAQKVVLAFRPLVNRLYLLAITTSRHLPLPQLEPPFGLFESVLKLRELGHHALHNIPIPHPCASRSLSVAHPRMQATIGL